MENLLKTLRLPLVTGSFLRKKSDWTSLPVARMHVSGKGLETTHYGNNVWLAEGKYEARVTVNNNPSAVFQFSLTK